MTLSRLDLSLFTSGNATNRRQFASDLLESLRRHGFVKIINHGIADHTVARLFEWVRVNSPRLVTGLSLSDESYFGYTQNKLFFQMQAHDKISIAHRPGPDPQRGWSKVGAENTSTLYRKGLLKSHVAEDLTDARKKEHFDQGPTNDAQYPNKWPSESVLPGFREYMERAFEELEHVNASIMEALEEAFGLPSGAFLNRITHEGNASEMRLNHYPAIDINEIKRGGVSRIWPHFDLGVITLLFQDGVGGLEFENREKRSTFNRVECASPAEMVVNVSETLQRWTNDALPAGLHRVNVPQYLEDKDVGTLPERYSIAYFCKADRGASVGPLREFVQEGSKPEYQEMSAIEYHQQRLQSAY